MDIRYPTDLSLLNVDEVLSEGVAREVTEILIDAMHPQIRESLYAFRGRDVQRRAACLTAHR